MEFVAGVILLAVSSIAFWRALPVNDEVRPFLRSEHAQTYYVVALLCGSSLGLLLTILGAMALLA